MPFMFSVNQEPIHLYDLNRQSVNEVSLCGKTGMPDFTNMDLETLAKYKDKICEACLDKSGISL